MAERDRFSLENRRALVTGGGSGLGKAMALAIAEHGARVAILDLDAELASSTALEIESRQVEALAIEGDVAEDGVARRVVEEVSSAWGGLDVLINNAGIGSLVPAETVELPDFKRIYDVNVFGLFAFSQAAFKPMSREGGGSIINMASMAALQDLYPDEDVAYHSAKAAVVMLTKSLAVEWAEFGIRVNAIAPGYMLTPPVAALRDDPDVWDYHIERTPLNRGGLPGDVQGAAVYLASGASSFVTGSVLVVDGGYTAM